MRIALDARARRWSRRLPVGSPYAIVRAALIVAIGAQAARLIWALLVPLGPVGDWRAVTPLPAADLTLLARFDPFSRLGPSQDAVAVTSLPLKLFGVRLNQATGGGSAIIATPDGLQSSFAIGEVVMPGVTLRGVAFDSVTIERGGALEQIFLDQSVPPRAVVGGAAASPAAPGTAAATAPIAGVTFTEPSDAGVTVGGDANNPAFRASGLQAGDVITAINGSRVTRGTQIDQVMARGQSGITTLTVTRAGNSLTVNVQGPGQ